jgi:putative membrane protein
MKYHSKADRFFTEEEKERIKNTTIDVESRTIGEIAVMVVDHSSQYHEAEIVGGVFIGSLVSIILSALYFHSSMWFFVPVAFLLFFPSQFLFKKMPVLKHVFVGKKRKEKAVRERALKAFYEKGLYKTKENTGVLFFLSLLERKVWVLADKGIHSKIHQPTLNKFAGMVSKGIREGRACDALIEAINEMGELLAKHYPAKAGDTDELPDEVICEPGAKDDTD